MFLAHQDAAHGGQIFSQQPITWIADRFPAWYERRRTSPPIMLPVAGGPALVPLGALLDLRTPRTLGTILSLGSLAAFADIATRNVVPGANDNLSAVAVVLELARLLNEAPATGVRVVLVSTGSEKSFMEGMRGFVRRHSAELRPERTRVICVESFGSPHLILIEGRGMIRIRDHPHEMRELPAEGSQRDVPANLDWRTVRQATAVCGAVIRLRASARP